MHSLARRYFQIGSLPGEHDHAAWADIVGHRLLHQCGRDLGLGPVPWLTRFFDGQ